MSIEKAVTTAPQLFVVMGNDFPAGVFDSESGAEAFCENRRKEDPNYGKEKQYLLPRISWRVYAFTLNRGER